jgi:2-polyprenyl-3-methyl-5-hydroxy-6-metoxy-1,4-benzoquinol methylase
MNTMKIVCPNCRAQLPSPEHWVEGTNSCPKCNAQFHKSNSVLRFVKDEGYADNFGHEWSVHSGLYLTEDEIASTIRTLHRLGLNPDTVKDKVVLDLGSGTGRFTSIFQSWNAKHVVAIDMSQAIDVTVGNTKAQPNTTYIQADLMNLPFGEGEFDIILAWGVLHHTPSTKKAFQAVVRHLKKGGSMHLFVYGTTKQLRRKVITLYRKITPHLPKAVLYALCWFAGPLFYVYKIPVIGVILRTVLPISRQPKRELRILETFDEYSPKYAWRHSFPEVFEWFSEAGFVDITIKNPPVNVYGRLPAHGD